MPEIIGEFREIGSAGEWNSIDVGYASGAFAFDGISQNKAIGTHVGNQTQEHPSTKFMASRYNNIYGNSTTVQPNALLMIPQIKY